MPKLTAVLLACVGVLFVVYGGQSASSDQVVSSSSSLTPTNQITPNGGSSAPLIGDLLTLIVSIASGMQSINSSTNVSSPSPPTQMNPSLHPRWCPFIVFTLLVYEFFGT